MASSQTLYSITITNGNTNAAPSDGFIDNLTIEDYNQNLETAPAGLTLALSQAKRRGNIRYREIINQFGIVANMYIFTNTIVSNATYKTEASSFSFYLLIEHGDASLTTPDENNPGQFLTGAACITRCIARALINNMERQEDFFDPTDTETFGVYGATTSVTRYGTRIWAAGVGTGSFVFQIGPYSPNLTNATNWITTNEVTF